MSGGDEMDSSTQVPAVRHTWVHVATSYHARDLMSSFPEVLALVVPTRCQKTLGEAAGNPRASPAGGRDEAG
jgi:hypothetical protein